MKSGFIKRAYCLIVASALLALSALNPLAAAELPHPRQHQQPTQLSDVLASARNHYPKILAAQAQLRSRQAQITAAQGAFDPRIDSRFYSRMSGFYGGTFIDNQFKQRLPQFNAEVFAGYRVSDGRFPLYEDEYFTNDAGEARIGFALSLLRDRDIDDRRFAVNKAQIEEQAELQRLRAQMINVQRSAYIAYAQWLLAARLAESYQDLLDLAERRGRALERSVEAGESAEILLVENRQAILQRQGLVMDGRRLQTVAAEQLALYLRDANGQPQYPLYAPQLQMPADDQQTLQQPLDQLINQALHQRPEIVIADLARQVAGLEGQLADNLAKPRLDLQFYSARDFGPGSTTREGIDNIINLQFSLPLRTREAQGRAASAQARAEGLTQEIRLLEDQVTTDMRVALVNVRTTRELEDNAKAELEASLTLADAEQRRFDSGLSDFFTLNIRERNVGEAQLKRWQAYLAHQVALANFYSASMNLAALGIEVPQ
ncbi:MAG: TolC family protein [Wenzhouxiangellaceae bacterium]